MIKAAGENLDGEGPRLGRGGQAWLLPWRISREHPRKRTVALGPDRHNAVKRS